MSEIMSKLNISNEPDGQGPIIALFEGSSDCESCEAVPGKFLGIVGQDPSDSKSNRLHVDIFHFSFIELWYFL
jgi:hypothetical protein